MGPLDWGLGVVLTTSPRKQFLITKPQRQPRFFKNCRAMEEEVLQNEWDDYSFHGLINWTSYSYEMTWYM